MNSSCWLRSVKQHAAFFIKNALFWKKPAELKGMSRDMFFHSQLSPHRPTTAIPRTGIPSGTKLDTALREAGIRQR